MPRSAATVVGALAVLGALVAVAMGFASHHFTDVKTWFAIAVGAGALGCGLLLLGRRHRAR